MIRPVINSIIRPVVKASVNPELGSSYWTHLNPLMFVKSANNPTTPGASESEIIMADDGVTCDQWWKHQENNLPTIYHRSANNALLDNWGESTECTGVSGYFPTVFKIGTDYYMFIKQSAWDTGDIYLYHSIDKIAWTVMNGGNPAITHNPSTSSWYNKVYNTAVCVIGTTIHLLVDGSDKTPSFPNPYSSGYASADISNPVFTLPETPTILNGGNCDIKYSSKHNSFVAGYSIFTGSPLDIPKSYTVFMTASLSNDLVLESSWIKSTLLFPSLNEEVTETTHYCSDYSICFTPGKTYGMMMYYCWNQATGYQAYANIKNANELYESLFISSTICVEEATPTVLKITHGAALNETFVPDKSAFSVVVNSVARTINSIAVSGSVVSLTLASAIIRDDVITVSYTKPQTNWLRNTLTSLPSFAAKSVENKVVLIYDADGNLYTKVKIGTQTWLVQPLKTTKYRNGDAITLVTLKATWPTLTTEAYCWPNGDISTKASYGALYNYFAAVDVRGITPVGYHVATDAELAALATYLTNNGYGYGGSGSDIGKSLANTALWAANATPGNPGNDQATNNLSGFKANPAGFRSGTNGDYGSYGAENYIITATPDGDNCFNYNISSSGPNFTRGTFSKKMGFTVRCIKD